MAQPTALDIVDPLTAFLYTQERVERSWHYLAHRGIDASTLRVPWTMTETDSRAMEPLGGLIRRPAYFANCLFIPVVDLRYDPDTLGKVVLGGFDVRHFDVGATDAKYTKVKRNSEAVMLYNAHEALQSPWVVLVESALDAESLRALPHPDDSSKPFPVVAALTALGSPQFAMLLYGMFERIYIMYDNDKGGAGATQKLLAAAERGGRAVREAFQPLIYGGEDPNDAYRNQGAGSLRRTLLSQLA